MKVLSGDVVLAILDGLILGYWPPCWVLRADVGTAICEGGTVVPSAADLRVVVDGDDEDDDDEVAAAVVVASNVALGVVEGACMV